MFTGFVIGFVVGVGLCWLRLWQMKKRLAEVTKIVKSVIDALADANALMRIQTGRIEALGSENNQLRNRIQRAGEGDRFAA